VKQNNFWKKLKKPIMAAAPMSGVTDEAFRLMLLKYGKPDVFWTEFVPVEGLLSKRGRNYCLKTLKFSKKERPIVAQVFGFNPESFKKAAEIIAELGFDGIDINMGCPDRNIEKTGAGSDLIKNPKLAREIIKATKEGAGKIPVSVKTRIGYKKNEVESWISEILKEKPDALTVHFRTREQLYMPPARWELAKEIIKLRDKYSPETIILGNGDVRSLQEAKKLAKEAEIDGVMIGRGVVGNPWFFVDKIPNKKQRLKAIVQHAELIEKLDMHFDSVKKHFHAYARDFEGSKELREALMKVKNLSETKKLIKNALSDKFN
jgi:nifR3 family TIM-barrel protein